MQQGCQRYGIRPTVVQVSVSLLLHGLFEAAVEDLVEGADPLVHLCLAVCGQQERALILHLELKGKATHFAVLKEHKGQTLISWSLIDPFSNATFAFAGLRRMWSR